MALLLPVLGLLICATLVTQVDLSRISILVATVGAAWLNWLVAHDRVKLDLRLNRVAMIAAPLSEPAPANLLLATVLTFRRDCFSRAHPIRKRPTARFLLDKMSLSVCGTV